MPPGMVQATAREYEIRRGDKWLGETINVTVSGEAASYWDNAVAKAQMRVTDDEAVIHEWNPAVTVTTNGDGDGVATFALSLTPAEAAALPTGRFVGDIELESDSFPKSTIITFTATVFPDITRD